MTDKKEEEEKEEEEEEEEKQKEKEEKKELDEAVPTHQELDKPEDHDQEQQPITQPTVPAPSQTSTGKIRSPVSHDNHMICSL